MACIYRLRGRCAKIEGKCDFKNSLSNCIATDNDFEIMRKEANKETSRFIADSPVEKLCSE